MKKSLLALFLVASTAHAKPIAGLNDYGVLLTPGRFSTHCVVNDPGISGSPTINAYSNGQVDCNTMQGLYADVYTQVREYLFAHNYDLTQPAITKTLSLRIITLAELNDPDNFSQTDAKCMYNDKCASGAYFGRTFYSDSSSNINVYVVYSSAGGRYSFVSTLKHELMHAILYRYRWNLILKNNEHALIYRFLAWKRNR